MLKATVRRGLEKSEQLGWLSELENPPEQQKYSDDRQGKTQSPGAAVTLGLYEGRNRGEQRWEV